MIIAVTSKDGEVFQHFGHSEEFTLFEVENGTVIETKKVATNGQGHGALADFLNVLSANVLICGGIGGGARGFSKLSPSFLGKRGLAGGLRNELPYTELKLLGERVPLFGEEAEVNWDAAKEAGLLPHVRKAVSAGAVDIMYSVKSRGKKKKTRLVSVPLSEKELLHAIESLPKQADKQKEALREINLK